MYCTHCGNPVSEPVAEEEVSAEAEVATAAEVTSADVEIERIRADKEVKIARISAGIAESETVADLAHAEGRAEGQREIIDAVTPEPEPEPEPVVVVDSEPAEPEPDSGPPEIEPAPSGPARKTNPWW